MEITGRHQKLRPRLLDSPSSDLLRNFAIVGDFANRTSVHGFNTGSYADQGSLTPAVTHRGVSTRHGSNVTHQTFRSDSNLGEGNNKPCTGFAVFSVPVVDATDRRFLDNSHNSGINSLYLTSSTAGLKLFWNNTTVVTGPVLVVDRVYSISYACTDGFQYLFVDGALAGVGSQAGFAGWIGGSRGFKLQGQVISPYTLHALVGGYGLLFNPGLAQQISEDPWWFFTSNRRRTYFVPAAAETLWAQSAL